MVVKRSVSRLWWASVGCLKSEGERVAPLQETREMFSLFDTLNRDNERSHPYSLGKKLPADNRMGFDPRMCVKYGKIVANACQE